MVISLYNLFMTRNKIMADTERTKKIQKLEEQIISGKTSPEIFKEYKDLTGKGGTLSQEEINKDPRFKNLTKEQKEGMVVYKIPSMGKLKSGLIDLGGITVRKKKKEKTKNKNIPKSRS